MNETKTIPSNVEDIILAAKFPHRMNFRNEPDRRNGRCSFASGMELVRKLTLLGRQFSMF